VKKNQSGARAIAQTEERAEKVSLWAGGRIMPSPSWTMFNEHKPLTFVAEAHRAGKSVCRRVTYGPSSQGAPAHILLTNLGF